MSETFWPAWANNFILAPTWGKEAFKHIIFVQQLDILPSILCKCGHLITRGEIPNPHGFCIIPDLKVEDAINNIRNSEESDSYVHFYSYSVEMLKCNNCGRLWIDYNGDSNYTPYQKE